MSSSLFSPKDLQQRSELYSLVTNTAVMVAMLERDHGIPPTETVGALAGLVWTTLASHLGDKIAREVWEAIADANRQPTFNLDLNVIEGERRHRPLA